MDSKVDSKADFYSEQLSQMVNTRDKTGCWAMQSRFVGWMSHALRKDINFGHQILY
jgi:hypothetical protein